MLLLVFRKHCYWYFELDNPTIVSQFQPQPPPQRHTSKVQPRMRPEDAQKSVKFELCITREPVFLGKCWHVFRPAPLSGGVSDVRANFLLAHTESGRSLFSQFIKVEDPVSRRFLKNEKTEGDSIGVFFLKIMETQGSDPVRFLERRFLERRFLVIELSLYAPTKLLSVAKPKKIKDEGKK